MKTTKHEALLYEKLPNSRVQCHICRWNCQINPANYGACGAYQNSEGVLYTLNYAVVSSMAADPIEKKPLFHFHPGSQVFSLGSLGCNLHCKHCQNWEISSVNTRTVQRGCQEIQPQIAMEMVLGYQCQGIAWTYNDPGIWLEYTLDCAKLARKNNLYTVYVTNGYSTPEALDTIGPYLDAWRVDIKGFSDTLYKELAGAPHWREILKVTSRAKSRWNMHVEVVTNIIPTMNDDDRQLEGIANWIRDELGELTPWHVTRFYPQHNLMHLAPTPLATLERACEIGEKAGLKFIYTGNVPGHRNENTTCYSCGKTNVERVGYQTSVAGLEGSKCRFCRAELNFRVSNQRGEDND
ncbi:MAG: AmmeMemoRadiSam system radical SAM enzyme [Dehalococcoidales bacterium]|nr:AmmeMemoRadiSam system radical SAM enzyme [Dehalococcoidales bacterium]